MKLTIVLVSFFAIMYTGCSSTYSVREYPSKKEYYDKVNNFILSKRVDITFKNDSTITIFEGGQIDNDSLRFISQKEMVDKKLFLNQIKKINYNDIGAVNLSAKLVLHTGEEIQVTDMVFLPDSSVQFKVQKIVENKFPLLVIKEIRYHKRWIGVPAGAVTGSIIGLITCVILGKQNHDDTNNNIPDIGSSPHDTEPMWITIPAGFLLGGGIGYWIGYKYIFEINP